MKFSRHLKSAIAIMGVTALSLGLLVNPAVASSKKWRANNNTDVKVKVFWAAAGCAGVKSACDGSNVTFVCKSKTLNPGDSSSYKFPDGTSARGKGVCRKEGTSSQKDHIDWVQNRTKNGIRLKDNGSPEFYNE